MHLLRTDLIDRVQRSRLCSASLLLALTLSMPASLLAGDPVATMSTGHDSTRDLSRPLQRSSAPVASAVDGVNTSDKEDKPLVSADGSVMFFNSNRRGDRPWARFSSFSRRFDDDIWVSTRVARAAGNERWSQPVNLGAPINSSGDEEVAAIGPDGQSVYFTSLRSGWESDGGPYYHAELRGAHWTAMKGLGGGISQFFLDRDRSFRFRVYGASISPDRRDFYFATTLHSTNGQQQIWVSHLRDNGWSYPENLGPVVNGEGGSCAPFIASDGKTLFFASARPGGFGGDDIYMTVRVNGRWQPAENVGAPINTAGDDQFLSVPASGERIYFSSSRGGNDDIYVAPLPEVLRPDQVVLLGGRVTDRVTGEPIEAQIVIEDLATGVALFSATSNASTGRYTLVLEPGRDYAVTLSAPGRGFTSRRYTLNAGSDFAQLDMNVEMSSLEAGSEFALNNIFFDFDSFVLRPESRSELRRLGLLMRENPDMRITVLGHTDSVGSESYNAMLSLQRAASVRDYVCNTYGIDSVRVGVKGLGSSMPATSNATEEGRQKNRRITFVVE